MTNQEWNDRLAASPESWAEYFELLYDDTWGFAFGYACSILGDRVRAEDAVQDAFTAVWRNAHSTNFKSLGRFKSYLRQAVYTSCMNLLRDLAGMEQINDGYEAGPRDHVVVGKFSNGECEDAEFYNLLTHCVDKIRPDRRRAAFELRHGVERTDGIITELKPCALTFAQVASVLSVSTRGAHFLVTEATDQIGVCLHIHVD